MPQVMNPGIQNNNDLSQIGSIAGLFIGGPAGAMAGGQAGGIGDQLSNPPAQNITFPDSGATQIDAMQRRSDQLSQDNLSTLKQAEASLPSLPEDVRQQYAPAIIQARMMAEKNGGQSNVPSNYA